MEKQERTKLMVRALDSMFSNVLEEYVRLEPLGLVTKDTDTITGIVKDCEAYFFDNATVNRFKFLKDLVVWVVIDDKPEVAFTTSNKWWINSETIPIPSMNEEERSYANDYILTIEISKVTEGDVQAVIDALKGDTYFKEATNAYAKEIEKYCGFAKVVPIGPFDYGDSKMSIFNIFIRGQLLGYINCFFYENSNVYCSVRTDLSDKLNPKIESKEFSSLEKAGNFIAFRE